LPPLVLGRRRFPGSSRLRHRYLFYCLRPAPSPTPDALCMWATGSLSLSRQLNNRKITPTHSLFLGVFCHLFHIQGLLPAAPYQRETFDVVLPRPRQLLPLHNLHTQRLRLASNTETAASGSIHSRFPQWLSSKTSQGDSRTQRTIAQRKPMMLHGAPRSTPHGKASSIVVYD
jgi:hypothetical protein